MHPTNPPNLTLQLGALCCALLWGLSAAQAPRAPQTRAPDAQAPHAECHARGGKAVARTELFFGLARPDGSTVSAAEFQQFIDREVTPRFPQGLTLLTGNGQFRATNGATVRESAKVLILLYPRDDAHSRHIEAIRAAYVQAFEQESVLRVESGSCASF